MAFEMQTGGNHPSYIRNFANLWVDRLPEYSIWFVVRKLFAEQHRSVFDEVNQLSPDRIRIVAMTDEESHQTRVENKFREFSGWKIFCKYAQSFDIDKGILMYSDHFQLPMLVGQSPPCQVSCIYFRPTFHYHLFQGYRPTWKQRLQAWRKKWMLSRVLKLKHLDVLYSLDPFATEFISANLKTHARVRTIPDSFVQPPVPEGRIAKLRGELNIEPDRKVLLLLGILDRRKGPLQLLEAVRRIPEPTKRKLCLLLMGKIDREIENSVLEQVELLQQERLVQLIANNRYITDTLVQDYYEISDVALTTYQGHMGMSSALIRAGLAGIPVLSSEYGLMGELVHRFRLGAVVDTTNSEAFTRSLENVVNRPKTEIFDPKSALQFANSHTPEKLGDTLVEWMSGSTEKSA